MVHRNPQVIKPVKSLDRGLNQLLNFVAINDWTTAEIVDRFCQFYGEKTTKIKLRRLMLGKFVTRRNVGVHLWHITNNGLDLIKQYEKRRAICRKLPR